MKIIKTAGIIIIVLLLAFNTYKILTTRESVYIDIGKLTDNYKLKKELDGKSTGRMMTLKNVIDSLKLAAGLQGGDKGNRSIDSNIRRLEYEFGRYYTQSGQELTQKVWDRLNPLIEKYGQEHKYKIIFGANGAGTILYGDKNYDITDDLIKYCNTAYEKGN